MLVFKHEPSLLITVESRKEEHMLLQAVPAQIGITPEQVTKALTAEFGTVLVGLTIENDDFEPLTTSIRSVLTSNVYDYFSVANVVTENAQTKGVVLGASSWTPSDDEDSETHMIYVVIHFDKGVMQHPEPFIYTVEEKVSVQNRKAVFLELMDILTS